MLFTIHLECEVDGDEFDIRAFTPTGEPLYRGMTIWTYTHLIRAVQERRDQLKARERASVEADKRHDD